MINIHELIESDEMGELSEVLREFPETAEQINTGSDDKPLHTAAYRDCINAVEILSEVGADPNSRGDFNRAPLHVAAIYASRPLVKLLLDAGAEPDVRDQFGFTPIFAAARSGEQGRSGVVEELSKAGTIMDLNIAICTGDLELAIELANNCGNVRKTTFPDALLPDLATAVSMELMDKVGIFEPKIERIPEVEKKFIPLLELLLQCGLDPNRSAFGEWPPLLTLSQSGAVGLLRILIRAGAKPELKAADGTTALDLAQEAPNPTEVRSILTAENG